MFRPGPIPRVWCVNTPTKVRYFDFAVNPDKDILRFDIAMNHMLFVQILQSCSHLGDILIIIRSRFVKC